jgi:hypothetical protein
MKPVIEWECNILHRLVMIEIGDDLDWIYKRWILML